MSKVECILSIKFRDGIAKSKTPEEVFRESLGKDWDRFSPQIGRVVRAFSEESLRIIAEWVAIVRRRFRYEPPDFSSFLLSECERDIVDDLAAVLHETEKVEAISVEPSSASISYAKPASCNTQVQRHLGEAPIGIGAEWAWEQGEAGQRVRLVDVEKGWKTLNHQDFRGVPIREIPGGKNRPDGHGTKVLGIIAARRSVGKNGIAHKLEYVGLSPVRRNYSDCDSVADAIVAGGHVLSPGDVLLVERHRAQDRRQWPVERRVEVFAIIRLITLYGISIVEPAGNGSRPLERMNDSGAIMVGAVNPIQSEKERYSVHEKSNYGSRVDCYAWGEEICTTSPLGEWSYFSDTSAAAAIVAGVVAIIQGVLRKTREEGRLEDIRSILRTHGTEVFLEGTERQEGRVPDLKEILEKIRSK